MSICIINVGYTGTGKTTWTKKKLQESPQQKFIYDPNGEYPEFGGKVNYDFEKFMKEATNKKDTLILYEEATIFFRHSSNNKEITNQLVRKRHTKNTYIFNFHAIHQVPLFIMDFCNYFVLRKTNDIDKNVWNKFNEFKGIYDAYKYVQESENRYDLVSLKMQ